MRIMGIDIGTTTVSVENFHPGALTVGVISGILNELHEQTCRR